jgi:pimeloyl-ACP methyl ester carboxylesterase
MSSIVRGLWELLSASGHRPPYVLVGHSFGGLLARAYASLRKQEVAALILIDPVSLDLWADCSAQNERRLRLGAKLCRRGVLLANIGIVRLALTALASGRTRLPKTIAKASAGKAVGTLGRLVGVVQKLPASLRPSVQSHWSNAKSFRALAEYLEILRPCACEARNLPLPPDIPLTILSAGDATDQELGERQLWVDRSIRGRHIKVSDSGHWLQLERPEQVAAAIVELIEFVRQPTNQ